jgi:hypothetical protein
MIPHVWLGGKALLPRASREGDQRCPREAANLFRVGLGDTSAATAAGTRRAGRSFATLAPKLLALSTLLFAMSVAGCARHPDRPARAAPAEARTCESEKAQLAPRPPPDCEFRAPERKTVDPEQFGRLKAAYERQCVRRAERAERQRQRRLRALKGCQAR